MGGGIKRIWEHAKYDHVLFLECDFCLTSNADTTKYIISQGINYIKSNEFDIIRLRSLKTPGHPIQHNLFKQNHYCTDDNGMNSLKEDSQLYLITHFLDNPHEIFPEQVQKINSSPCIYKMSNKNCVYTNNPTIISRSFYDLFIKQYAIDGSHVEPQVDMVWPYGVSHTIAVTEGLFTHNRIDGHINCDCCPIKYGGQTDICTLKCCPSTITGIIEYTL